MLFLLGWLTLCGSYPARHSSPLTANLLLYVFPPSDKWRPLTTTDSREKSLEDGSLGLFFLYLFYSSFLQPFSSQEGCAVQLSTSCPYWPTLYGKCAEDLRWNSLHVSEEWMWWRTQDCCDFGIGSHALNSAKSHPLISNLLSKISLELLYK